MPLSHIALAVFIQILWGPIYTLAKPVVGDWFPPVLLVSVIYTTVALLLSPIYPRAKTPGRTLFILAFFGCTLQSTAVYYGLKLLPASMAVLRPRCRSAIVTAASGRRYPTTASPVADSTASCNSR